MAKAYSYIRFSSPQQALGDSLRRQMEATQKYCAANGLTLDDSCRMTDAGLSGYHGDHVKHGALGQFLKLIEKGQIEKGSVLIVEHLDRLSRAEPMVAQTQFNNVILAGVDIVTTVDGQRYSRKTINKEPFRLFVTLGQMIGSNAESEKKGERVKEAWIKRRQSPVNNVSPSWIKDGEIDEAMANVVRRAYRDVVHVGLAQLAFQFNAEKLATLTSRKRTRTTNLWDAATLRQLIRSRRALGEQQVGHMEGKKRILTDQWVKVFPAIITEGEWHAANKALDVRTKKGAKRDGNVPRLTNLFGDLASCGACGGRMTVRQRSRLGDWYYAACGTNKLGQCSNGRYHRLHDVERFVLDFCGAGALRDSEPNRTDPTILLATQLADATAELAKLEGSYIAMFKRFSGSDLDDKALSSMREDVKAQESTVRRLQGALDSAKGGEPMETRFEEFKALIKGMDGLPEDQKLSIRHRISLALPGFVKSVIFGADGRVQMKLADSISDRWLVRGTGFDGRQIGAFVYDPAKPEKIGAMLA